jgi:hypothetical protein
MFSVAALSKSDLPDRARLSSVVVVAVLFGASLFRALGLDKAP